MKDIFNALKAIQEGILAEGAYTDDQLLIKAAEIQSIKE